MGEAAGEVTGWEDDRPRVADPAAEDVAADPEVDQLVEEIEVTRVEMTGTVEQIGERLDPKNIVAGARETVREATVGKVESMVNDAGQSAQQAGTGLIEMIRRNPVPAAMAGIGIGWLVMSARSQSQQRGGQWQARIAGNGGGYGGYGAPGAWSGGRYEAGGFAPEYPGPAPTYAPPGSWDTSRMGRGSGGPGIGQQVGDRLGQAGQTAGDRLGQAGQTAGDRLGQAGQAAGNVAGNVQQTATDVASSVGQTAGEVVGNVQQTAGQVAETVGQRAEQGAQQVQTVARDAGSTASRMYEENPLAIGAIAVAVGTAVGMVLPATRAERNVLGPARDQLVGRAESTASEALSSAEQQARGLEQQAREQDQQSRDEQQRNGQG